MKLNTEHKLLIDGYIEEVSLNLPKKMRAEITAEIHSLIMDALEDRTEDGEVDEAALLSILRELGSPVEMAGSYHPHNFVIGPQMYAPFWMTMRWTFIIMTISYLLGFAISWGDASQSLSTFWVTIWELISGYWDSALNNIRHHLPGIHPSGKDPTERGLGRPAEGLGSDFTGSIPAADFRTTYTGDWDPKMLDDHTKI